jgi:hypothetical protein
LGDGVIGRVGERSRDAVSLLSPPSVVTDSPDHFLHGKLAAWRFKNFALGFIDKYGVPGIRRRGGGKKKRNGIHKNVDKITGMDDTP